MNDSQRRPPISSDRPPDDLKRERDAFIQQFFRKGAQLTEELLRENERLRDHINEVEAENGKLRAHLASDEAIRDLLRKIEELEHEKRDLLNRSVHAEAVKDNYSSIHAEVEVELANFANLYVATSQLHVARSVRGVLRALKELLAQLLGAGAFAVYLVNDEQTELVAIATEGVPGADVARMSLEDGLVARAYTTGELTFGTKRDVTKVSIADPAAVVPLRIDGRIVGAIAIFGTLPQKTEFVQTDRELFKLLGAQAAPALVNARLFNDAGRKMPGLKAFLDLED